MAINDSKVKVFEFEGFRLDARKRLLKNKNGDVVPLTPKLFETLIYLVENCGRIVEKDELMTVIWPDTIVEENNLSQNISTLRRVLGENRGEHRFIATVQGRGFKFVADVVKVEHERQILSTTGEISRTGTLDDDTVRDRDPRSKKWLIAAAGVVVLIIAGGLLLIRSWNRSELSSVELTKTIAVLPFRPLVADDRDETLEMGMADTLIGRLSDDRDLIVRPLSSVRKFGSIEQDAVSAGRELGVQSVLDGSIQRSDEKIRVTVRLTDVATGTSIWNSTYDEKFTDIFSIQDLIAGKVAEVLKLRLRKDNDHHEKRVNVDPDAYRSYLQARYFAQKITAPEVRKGIQFFEKAIEAEPTYALAYAGMADAYRSLPINGDVPSADAFPKAKAAATKALEIDPDIAEAHTVLGWIAFWFDHDWQTSEREFQLSLSLSPNNADAHRGFSVMLTCLGRHSEAIKEMRIARDLDPLSLINGALEGQALLFAGRYDESRISLNKTFEVDPNFWVAHIQLSRLLIQEGNFEAAVKEAEIAEQFSGGNSEGISLAGYAYAKSGKLAAAQAELTRLKEMSSNGAVAHYNLAMLYNGLGKTDDAIESLKEALAVSDVRLILLKVDPKWDNLRSDPRFAALMRQMNFGE